METSLRRTSETHWDESALPGEAEKICLHNDSYFDAAVTVFPSIISNNCPIILLRAVPFISLNRTIAISCRPIQKMRIQPQYHHLAPQPQDRSGSLPQSLPHIPRPAMRISFSESASGTSPKAGLAPIQQISCRIKPAGISRRALGILFLDSSPIVFAHHHLADLITTIAQRNRNFGVKRGDLVTSFPIQIFRIPNPGLRIPCKTQVNHCNCSSGKPTLRSTLRLI